MPTPDLSTRYLGLELETPIVASSSPLTGDPRQASALQEAGASAIVLPSLFQEQIEHEELEFERLQQLGADSFHEATGYLPEFEAYNSGLDGYLLLVERQRAELDIPVIASLNGVSKDGWARYAKLIEEAGAQAIELNLMFVPTDPALSGGDVEEIFVQQTRAVTEAVSIPVAVKIGPHLTAPVHFAAKMAEAGASGLVLFNRFLEPDIDLESMDVVPRLELSHPAEMRVALRWTAILSAHSELSLACTGGVHAAADALKLLLAGADAVMLASLLLRKEPSHLRGFLVQLRSLLEQHEFSSIEQLKGSMNHHNCPDPAGYERLNYMRALISYSSAQP